MGGSKGRGRPPRWRGDRERRIHVRSSLLRSDLQQRLDSVLVLGRGTSRVYGAYVRPLEPGFGNAVWHLRSLSARSSLGDLRSSLQVVPPRRRFWRLLARVVLVCFGVVPSLPWAISRAGSGRTGSSRRALHGPQNLLGIGDWLLLPTACHTQAGRVWCSLTSVRPRCSSRGRTCCCRIAAGRDLGSLPRRRFRCSFWRPPTAPACRGRCAAARCVAFRHLVGRLLSRRWQHAF